MTKSYTSTQIISRLSSYFKNTNCKNLYKEACLNYKGVTKDTNETYSKVIVDYLAQNIKDFISQLSKIGITRKKSYKVKSHNGLSDFNFEKHIAGERREEKISHAMFCQHKNNPTVFGRILDYQIPLKNISSDSGVGKIDLLSSKTYKNDGEERNKIYILELKKDNSKESLLRCILEAYTYSKIVNKEKLCSDFDLPFKDPKNPYAEYDFAIAPLMYKSCDIKKELKDVDPLINALDVPVEIFTWKYYSGKYVIREG